MYHVRVPAVERRVMQTSFERRSGDVVVSREVFIGSAGVVCAVLGFGVLTLITNSSQGSVLNERLASIQASVSSLQSQTSEINTLMQAESRSGLETRVRLQVLTDRVVKVESNMSDLWDRLTLGLTPIEKENARRK